MKNFMLVAATLLVLAGSAFSANTFSPNQVAAATTPKKPTATTDSIPPPSCPANDPRGCGIFD